MTIFVNVLLVIIAGVVGAIVWNKMRHDAVGRRTRERKQTTGMQGQVSEWLYWDAGLDPPDLHRYTDQDPQRGQPTRTADRAIYAIVLRESLDRNLALPEAFHQVKGRAKSPLARAFLSGQTKKAVRIYWQGRYRGPPNLYLLWFYLVASIRYGRRQLFLETMSSALKELNVQ